MLCVENVTKDDENIATELHLRSFEFGKVKGHRQDS